MFGGDIARINGVLDLGLRWGPGVKHHRSGGQQTVYNNNNNNNNNPRTHMVPLTI
jgi:hypothetical protein